MSVSLVTGSTGFLGRHLLPLLLERGDTVVALYHNVLPLEHNRVIPIQGDISRDGEWQSRIPKLDSVYHVAGLIDLSSSHHKKVWEVNVEGTQRVLGVAEKAHASHFYYVSTAFTQSRNPYELSKSRAESDVLLFGCRTSVQTTIFKPSIIVGHTTQPIAEASHGLYQIIKAIAWVHRRFEPLRQKVEGTLRLPPVELVFRIPGDEKLQLDIVPVDWVAETIAQTYAPGVFWLTNANAPTLKELAEWVGEMLWLDIKFTREFKASPVEVLFQRAVKSFLPYLQPCAAFTPSLDSCPVLGKEFVQRTALVTLLG